MSVAIVKLSRELHKCQNEVILDSVLCDHGDWLVIGQEAVRVRAVDGSSVFVERGVSSGCHGAGTQVAIVKAGTIIKDLEEEIKNAIGVEESCCLTEDK